MKYVLVTTLGDTEFYMGNNDWATTDLLQAHTESSVILALNYGENLNLSSQWHVKGIQD